MELITNSFEENPRTAPVPKLFTDSPVFATVPEVSLVFSPPPSKNLGITSISKEITVTNESNREKGHFITSPKNAYVNSSSTAAVRSMKQISPNNYMLKSPLKQTSNQEAKFLESVGVMANKILEENSQRSQQCDHPSRQHPNKITDNCIREDMNILMTQQLQNNSRNPPPIAHQCSSIMANRMGLNCQDHAVNQNFYYENSVGKEIGRHRMGSSFKNPTESKFASKNPVAHYPNISTNSDFGRKSCLGSQKMSQNAACMCHIHTNIASYDNDPYSMNKNQELCCCLYERRPCYCTKLPVQVCPPALSNNSRSVIPVPPLSFPSSGMMSKSLERINHDCSKANDEISSSINENQNMVSSITNEKAENGASSPFATEYQLPLHIMRSTGTNNEKNKSDSRVNIEAPKTANKETSSTKKLKSLETLEEGCEEELTKDSVTRRNVNERKEHSQGTSNRSLLQEIVEINKNQCSFIQGLLQQVVAMQADQMKILGQISEKLNNVLSLDANSKKYTDVSKTCSVISATTQTDSLEKPFITHTSCQQFEEKVQSQDDLSTNVEMKRCSCNRAEVDDATEFRSSPIQCEVVSAAQIESTIEKKLPDRAVSWSAVHGVETVEESFTLHGVCVPTVVEQMPSSIHTMHLHMQDYHSSASFESISESRSASENKCCENNLDNKGSWTLYDNIVGHVKKFLHTVPCEKNSSSVQQKSSQVEAIRFATIEKIRQLGVSVYENSTEIKEVSTTGRIHFDSKVAHCPSLLEQNSSDASLELQSLAHKYLPDYDLGDIAKLNNGKRCSGLKAGQKSTNVSIATQNYLEKYNLLASYTEDKNKQQMFSNASPAGMGNNILDITTLKKQPKLL